MKAFQLVLPKTVDEAVAALPESAAATDRVRVLAGGQDLLGEMKDYLVSPDKVVNLKGVAGIEGTIQGPDGELQIGALTRLAALEKDAELASSHPMLVEAAGAVATPQIRSMGTLGGNLCQRPRCFYYRNAQAPCLKKGGTECFSYGGLNKYNAILGGGPSYIVHPSDVAPALVAYDATIVVQGPHGERLVHADSFFTLPSEGEVTRENVLAANEIVTGVKIPAGREAWKATYLKVRERDSFDFALSAVALALRMNGDTIEEARLCLGGVAPKPWRCLSTEELLVGRKVDDETCRLAGEDALRMAEPLEQNGYKVPMTQGLIRRALQKLG